MINKRLPIRDEDHVFICCVLVGIMKYATSYSWCKLVKIKGGMLFLHHIAGVDLLFVDVHF